MEVAIIVVSVGQDDFNYTWGIEHHMHCKKLLLSIRNSFHQPERKAQDHANYQADCLVLRRLVNLLVYSIYPIIILVQSYCVKHANCFLLLFQ
jgi:hypothetical protein